MKPELIFLQVRVPKVDLGDVSDHLPVPESSRERWETCYDIRDARINEEKVLRLVLWFLSG